MAVIGGQICNEGAAQRQAQVREAMDGLYTAIGQMESALVLMTERVQTVVVPVPQAPDTQSNKVPRAVEARCDLAEAIHQQAERTSYMAGCLRELASRIEL